MAANQALFSAKIFLALGRLPMAGEWWEACSLLVFPVWSLLVGVEFFIGEGRRRLQQSLAANQALFSAKIFFPLGRLPMAGEWWEACSLLVFGVWSLSEDLDILMG